MNAVKLFVGEAIKGLDAKTPEQLTRFEEELVRIFESYPRLFEQAQRQVKDMSKYGICAIYRYGCYVWNLFQNPEVRLATELNRIRVYVSREKGTLKAWLAKAE